MAEKEIWRNKEKSNAIANCAFAKLMTGQQQVMDFLAL